VRAPVPETELVGHVAFVIPSPGPLSVLIVASVAVLLCAGIVVALKRHR
jgi:hypothetical protein